MNRSYAKTPALALRLIFLAGLPAAILGLTGCGEKPRPIELARPASTPVPRPKETPRPQTTPVPAPEPTPIPTPVVTPLPTPLVIMARDMNLSAASGTSDSLGGVIIASNGALQLDNVEIPFTVGKVVVEMKGDPAKTVWPEVDLNAYNRTIQKSYFPLPRTMVTTSTYHMYHLPQKERIPEPGSYLITFRYYNNQDSPETKEDRNAYLRRIEFHPKDDLAEEP